MLNRLLLRGGPIIMLCGRDFVTVSGDTAERVGAYMLCGLALRIASGVAGGDTAIAIGEAESLNSHRASFAAAANRPVQPDLDEGCCRAVGVIEADHRNCARNYGSVIDICTTSRAIDTDCILTELQLKVSHSHKSDSEGV